MANPKAHAQFDRAKWRLFILAPAWSLQLTLAFGMLGLFSWRLGDTVHNFDERHKAGKAPVIEYVWEATNIAMSFVVALCTIFEIAKYFSESLTPWTMLFTHVVKLACASAILALDVVIYVQRDDSHYSLIGLGMDGLLMLTAISLAIYAILAYRRLSKYDEYSSPVDAKSYLFNDGLDIDTSYSHVSYSNASFSSRPGERGSADKRESLGSSRLSVGSVTNPTILEPVEQRPRRYSHERDTQFDEYVSRRASGGYKPSSAPSSPPIVVTLDDSLASLGTVHSRSRGSSVSQLTTSDHVLVSVPEEDGETSPSTSRKPDQQVGLAR